MDSYYSVRQNQDTAEIVNPAGQVFCQVNMGPGLYDTLTKRRGEIVRDALNMYRNSMIGQQIFNMSKVEQPQ